MAFANAATMLLQISMSDHVHKNTSWNRWLLYGAVGLIVFIVDQATKACTLLIGPRGIGLPGIITLRSVSNSGAAFSLAQGYSALFLFIAIAVVVLLTFYVGYFRPQNKLILIGTGLIVGGATGNALDRFLTGRILDFISLDCIHFPIFNVADAAITCGFALILIIVWRRGVGILFPLVPRKSQAPQCSSNNKKSMK